MTFNNNTSAFVLDYLKISVTKKCNYTCSFCSQSDFLNSASLDFPTAAERVFSLFTPRLIILTGGEPLIEPRIINDYIHYCREKDVELGIFTNMSLLTPGIAEEMKTLDKLWLRTTINGADEKTHETMYPEGSFKTLIDSVTLALKYGIKLKVRVTVTKKNIEALPAIVNLVTTLGIAEIDFRPYAPLSQHEHDEFTLPVEEHLRALKSILELKKAYPAARIKLLPNWFDYIVLPIDRLGDCELCKCGKAYLYIDSNGDILTCAGYRNALGNIYTDNILDVFKNTPFLEEIKKERFGKYCQSCPVYFQCRRSNCHIVNFEFFHTLDSVNPLCPIFKLSPESARTGYDTVRGMYRSLK